MLLREEETSPRSPALRKFSSRHMMVSLWLPIYGELDPLGFPCFFHQAKDGLFRISGSCPRAFGGPCYPDGKNTTHLDLPIHPAQRDPEEVQCRLPIPNWYWRLPPKQQSAVDIGKSLTRHHDFTLIGPCKKHIWRIPAIRGVPVPSGP